jgi:hypothetical protein
MGHAASSPAPARPLSERSFLRLGVASALEREAAAEPPCAPPLAPQAAAGGAAQAPPPWWCPCWVRARRPPASCDCRGCVALNAVPGAQAQLMGLLHRDPALLAERLLGAPQFKRDAATLSLLFAVQLDPDDVQLMAFNGSLCCSPACASAIALEGAGSSIQDRLSACGGCRGAVYCSTPCQRAHWKKHKARCQQRQALRPSAARVATEELQHLVVRNSSSAAAFARVLAAGADPLQRLSMSSIGALGLSSGGTRNADEIVDLGKVVCSTMNGTPSFQHAALEGNVVACEWGVA